MLQKANPVTLALNSLDTCKFLLSKASKTMLETLVPMKIQALSAHLTEANLTYSDYKNDGLCGQMASQRPFGHQNGSIESSHRGNMRPFHNLIEIENCLTGSDS